MFIIYNIFTRRYKPYIAHDDDGEYYVYVAEEEH